VIGKLKGIIDTIADDHVIIDVGGVGYVALCSKSSLAKIGSVGSSTSILIETHVREDQITLFGFATSEEKQWFLLLVKVNGVGPKMALNILSNLDINSLATAIAAADKAAFKPISGVGPKIAERIITELKDKDAPMVGVGNVVSLDANGEAQPTNMSNANLIDATAALEQLGFNKSEAFSVVSRTIANNKDAQVEFLIKEGLKELSSR